MRDNELKKAVSKDSSHFDFWKYATNMLSKMSFVEPVASKPKTSGIPKTNEKSKQTIRKTNETEKETNRTKNIQNWTSTVMGYAEICRRCFDLNMTKISLR